MGDLGIAAKVAPDEGDDRKPRLICVYTRDFTDLKDVSRVLNRLVDLGIVEKKGRPIYYKCGMFITSETIDSKAFPSSHLRLRCLYPPRSEVRQSVEY